MAPKIDRYDGYAIRRCDQCGLVSQVQVPHRIVADPAITPDAGQERPSSSSWKRAYQKELRRQLLWVAMCESCHQFWTEVVRRCDEDDLGPLPPAAEAPTVALPLREAITEVRDRPTAYKSPKAPGHLAVAKPPTFGERLKPYRKTFEPDKAVTGRQVHNAIRALGQAGLT